MSDYQAWPALPYNDFASTSHLLHMAVQAIGKLKLSTPFEPEWANVALWITSRGVTSGPMPYSGGIYNVDIDLIKHQVICETSWSRTTSFKIESMSVADFVETLLSHLREIGVVVTINPKPQEIPNPIVFNHDTEVRHYDAELANNWWRILVNTYRIMLQYHARFIGKTQPIGLMWGTFDIRDVRYNGQAAATTGLGYLRRNAMDECLIEVGWWSGNDIYPRPAFYSFTYPKPASIEQAKVAPNAAHWDAKMGEFILDYEDLRKSKTPDADLLTFFESTYKVGAKLAGWDDKLVGSGKPV